MDDAPLILSIETATLAGSVSLSRGNDVLTTISGDNRVSHSNTLLSEIDTVLRETNHALHDVELYAVATGPGSFTGLRIGIATVKALAFTLQRPCVGVPTLHAVAHSAGSCERVVAVLPAGRGEVFVQMFRVSGEDVIPLDAATHLAPLEMLKKYSAVRDVCWCGQGAQAQVDLIKTFAEEARTGWRIVSQAAPLAVNVGALALKKADANDFLTPEALAALYVRPSDAELKVNQ